MTVNFTDVPCPKCGPVEITVEVPRLDVPIKAPCPKCGTPLQWDFGGAHLAQPTGPIPDDGEKPT